MRVLGCNLHQPPQPLLWSHHRSKQQDSSLTQLCKALSVVRRAFWHQWMITWGVAVQMPPALHTWGDGHPERDAKWHGCGQRANRWKCGDGNSDLLPLRSRIFVFLQKWHWLLHKQWGCLNHLCFWIRLIFSFNLPDTIHPIQLILSQWSWVAVHVWAFWRGWSSNLLGF